MPTTAKAYELQNRPELELITDSQEIGFTLEYVRDSQLEAVNVTREDITALMVSTGEGDFIEVWAAETAQPYSNAATYTRIF